MTHEYSAMVRDIQVANAERHRETEILDIDVHGTPAPQGSKRHVGNGIMVESSAKVKPWREAVKAAVPTVEGVFGGAVSVEIAFNLARPKGHHGTGNNANRLRPSAPRRPAVKPDIDKLVRSTLDALKDAGVYRDDSQVVNLAARKFYAMPGETPGARITVRSIT